MNSAVLIPENSVAKSRSARRGNRRPLVKGFRLGDRVRVREGVRTSQRPGIIMEGWTGKVVRVIKRRIPTCLVCWDGATLATVPPRMRRCYRQDWMYTDELLPAVEASVSKLIPRPWTKPQVSRGGAGLSWNDRDDRIRAVFGLDAGKPLPPVTPDSLLQYASYLQWHMPDAGWLPGTHISENGYRTEGVFRIARDAQGDFQWNLPCGVLCRFGRKGEVLTVSLNQLDLDRHSPYVDLVNDYRAWMCYISHLLPSDDHVYNIA